MFNIDERKQAIVDETLTWVGTPYHHQARVKGVGVDCAQLIAGVAEGAGIRQNIVIPVNYSPEWHVHNRHEWMLEIMEQMGCKRLPPDQIPTPGDIVAFKVGRAHGHLGILVSSTEFVHAELAGSEKGTEMGKVVRVHMAGAWSRMDHIFYEFPEE